VVVEPEDDVPVTPVEPVVVDGGAAVPVGSGEPDGGVVPGGVAPGDCVPGDVSVGAEPSGAVVLVSVGPAHATPGVVATAIPTPDATANAPTRPIYRA
jgi:hypothetical protein